MGPEVEVVLRHLPEIIAGGIKGYKELKAFKEKKEENVVKLNTPGSDLPSKTFPGTDVKYIGKKVNIEGTSYSGVFPKFNSKYETWLPPGLREVSDEKQALYCTKKLKEEMARRPKLEKRFNKRQIKQIKAGSPKISGLIWHCNEEPGKMQLVNEKEHAMCEHMGGEKLWGNDRERVKICKGKIF